MKTVTKTRLVGKVFHFFPEIDSTNARALEYIRSGSTPEGTVFVANHQLAGRGQGGKTWFNSPGKSILLSAVFYPVFLPPAKHFRLTQAFSLAVLDLLTPIIRDTKNPGTEIFTKIKWPNDIYVKEKKIAGILLQSGISGSRFNFCVVGIGLNVLEENFPVELPNPTSLLLETGKRFSLEVLTEGLCQAIENRYLALKGGADTTLQESYRQQLYLRDEWATFADKGGNQFEGLIRHVTSEGMLSMELKNGTTRTFLHGEVSYLQPSL